MVIDDMIAFARVSEVAAGALVEVHPDYLVVGKLSCVGPGHHTVRQDAETGEFFVVDPCGRHYLVPDQNGICEGWMLV